MKKLKIKLNMRQIAMVVAATYFLTSTWNGVLPPINLGATVFYTVLLSAVLLQFKKIPGWMTVLSIVTEIVIVYLSITSNFALTVVSNLTVLFGITVLLAKLSVKSDELSVGLYIKAIVVAFPHYLRVFFSRKSVKEFFSQKIFADFELKEKIQKVFSRNRVVSLFVAILTVTVFHLLFSSVNEEYRTVILEFLENWREHIVRVIRYIFNYLYLVPLSYIVFVIFRNAQQMEIRPKTRISTQDWITFATIVLGACTMLFLLFDYFQVREILALDYNIKSNFKEFSLYVQRGFWELIASAGLGFLIINLIKYKIGVGRRWLSAAFVFLLLILDLFALHKVLGLQITFGLKDIRVLATSAIILIFVALSVILADYLRNKASKSSFKIIIFSFVGLIALLNMSNVSRLITTLYPPVFYYAGERFYDYPFMLTRDYDNNAEYSEILEDLKNDIARAHPVQKPEVSRWGYYPALDDSDYGWYQHLAQIEKKYKLKTSLKRKVMYSINGTEGLEAGDKYIEDARFFFSFNLRELQTYRRIIEREIDYEHEIIQSL
ncbi:DUF4173 domain-containing protein [Candidatus Dojkabacteria bacterium]|nr:DUF4173 domain-containing protein [Candidatus Dojkabacteria bacterium]